MHLCVWCACSQACVLISLRVSASRSAIAFSSKKLDPTKEFAHCGYKYEWLGVPFRDPTSSVRHLYSPENDDDADDDEDDENKSGDEGSNASNSLVHPTVSLAS